MMRTRWAVLVGCLVVLTLSFAPAYLFTLGVFSKAMAAELGWSRTQVAAGFSIAQLAVALFSTVSGAALDRIGNRPVILFAAVALPLVLAAFGAVSSFLLYVGLAFCIGAVGSASNPPAVLSLLPKWFDRHLGLSLSLASLGIGFGGMLMPILARAVQDAFGWRGGFAVLAALIAVLGILNAWALIRDPPVPVAAATPMAGANRQDGTAFADCIRRVDYWLIVAAFTVIGAVYWGTTSQLGPILSDRGLGQADTAAALSTMGIAVIVGRTLGGVLLDRISAYLIGTAVFLSAAAGCLLLTVPGLDGSPYLAAILLGAALGGEGDVMAYVLRRRYGQAAYGKIFGLCFGVFNLGGLTGPLALAQASDRWHSYQAAGLAFAGAGFLAAVVFLLIGSMTAPRGGRERAAPARAAALDV